MKTFAIELRRTEHGSVTVSAENKSEAIKKAVELANEGTEGGGWEAVSLSHGAECMIKRHFEKFDIPQY